MKQGYNRKTTPKVKNGAVQKKNNHGITAKEKYVIDRITPDKGFKHVISKKDIHDFVDLIPDWNNISSGIESIILDRGNESFDGLYEHYYREGTGTIWLSAWPQDLWVDFEEDYFREHQWHFDLFRVVYEKQGEAWVCHFTENQAKAFMLLHIFLHELGHHVDRLRSKNKNKIRGGEDFAETYANNLCKEIWPQYLSHFGQP